MDDYHVVFKGSVVFRRPPEHLIRVSAMVGPRGYATCNRAVFWTCEWLGVEGDLSAPMRSMHRSGKDMKSVNVSRCQATPVGKAASVHMIRNVHGHRCLDVGRRP